MSLQNVHTHSRPQEQNKAVWTRPGKGKEGERGPLQFLCRLGHSTRAQGKNLDHLSTISRPSLDRGACSDPPHTPHNLDIFPRTRRCTTCRGWELTLAPARHAPSAAREARLSDCTATQRTPKLAISSPRQQGRNHLIALLSPTAALPPA